MLVLVQLPFADARPFVPGSGRLRTPPWPLAEPDREFVRAVGAVRERRRGGVWPWVGEHVYCDARRALRISTAGSQGRRSPCWFRRYLSDGHARTRLEIGMLAPRSSVDVHAILAGALSLQFSVPQPSGPVAGGLLELRQALARHLLRSTTATAAGRGLVRPGEEDWWLEPVQPLIVVECQEGSRVRAAGSSSVAVADGHGISLRTFTVQLDGVRSRVWLIGPQPGVDRQALRRLRVHLLLLHAERVVLRHVLRLLARGRLRTDRGSEEFDRLQRYLLASSRTLGSERGHGLRQEPILQAACEADDLFSEDLRLAISAQLRDARLSIRRAVERQLDREGARASVQIWNELAPRVSLADLSRQLDDLHRELSLRDGARDHSEALVVVAEAGRLASLGDGPDTLAHLARAGQWVLGAARDIGVDLAAAVIGRLMGA